MSDQDDESLSRWLGVSEPRRSGGSWRWCRRRSPDGETGLSCSRAVGSESRAAIVRHAYQLAAAGATDWQVAGATALKKTHVGEILTNPIYAGACGRE